MAPCEEPETGACPTRPSLFLAPHSASHLPHKHVLPSLQLAKLRVPTRLIEHHLPCSPSHLMACPRAAPGFLGSAPARGTLARHGSQLILMCPIPDRRGSGRGGGGAGAGGRHKQRLRCEVGPW